MDLHDLQWLNNLYDNQLEESIEARHAKDSGNTSMSKQFGDLDNVYNVKPTKPNQKKSNRLKIE